MLTSINIRLKSKFAVVTEYSDHRSLSAPTNQFSFVSVLPENHAAECRKHSTPRDSSVPGLHRLPSIICTTKKPSWSSIRPFATDGAILRIHRICGVGSACCLNCLRLTHLAKLPEPGHQASSRPSVCPFRPPTFRITYYPCSRRCHLPSSETAKRPAISVAKIRFCPNARSFCHARWKRKQLPKLGEYHHSSLPKENSLVAR